MLHVGSPVADSGVPLAVVVVGFANENHVKCIPQSVQVVGMKLRSLSSHGTTARSIVAIATSPRTPVAHVTIVHAGSQDDSN